MATSLHAELDRQLFNTIADKYFAKDLAVSSRRARRQRLLQTLHTIPLAADAALLEVGCGAGFTVRYLDGHCRSYCGVDYAEQLIEYARLHNHREGARFVASDVMELDCQEEFDAVLMIGVLHHFDDISETLRHVVSLVKPGGWVVANEPQPGNPLVHLARALRKRIDGSYSSDQRELTQEDLRGLYVQAGLEDVRIVPQGFFSTPFAEVVLAPQLLTAPMSRLACRIDRLLESTVGPCTARLSWNLVAAGRRPV